MVRGWGPARQPSRRRGRGPRRFPSRHGSTIHLREVVYGPARSIVSAWSPPAETRSSRIDKWSRLGEPGLFGPGTKAFQEGWKQPFESRPPVEPRNNTTFRVA